MVSETEQVNIEPNQIISLNKSRQRAIYWRQDNNGGWVQTNPLPADPQSINYYLSKGLRGKKPEDGGQTVVQDGTAKCPFCEFVTESPLGLRSHLRKHINLKKEETK